MFRVAVLVIVTMMIFGYFGIAAQRGRQPSTEDPIRIVGSEPLVINGKLTKDDPPDSLLKKSPRKVHQVTLKAGQNYQIDLASKSFDPFLRLEDGAGKQIAFDDDGGNALNSRLLVKTKKGGVYRIIVTAYPKGETTGKYTLRIGESTIDPEAKRRAGEKVIAINDKVTELIQQRRTQEALPLAKKAVEIGRKFQAEKTHLFATCLSNLATLYTEAGRYEMALPLHLEAKDLAKHLYGEQAPFYAITLANLGKLYQMMGRFQPALPLMQQATGIFKKHFGDRHAYYATSLNNLATLYVEMGESDKAVRLLMKVKELYDREPGPFAIQKAINSINLSVAFQKRGWYYKALPLCLHAVDDLKKLHGENHADYAVGLNTLGLLYREMGLHEKALTTAQAAKEIFKKTVGEKHPRYAIALHNLALHCQTTGDYKQALPLYKQAEDIRKETLGEEHPLYALTLNDLALTFQALGKAEQALHECESARAVIQKSLGKNHPTYALALSNLAGLHLRTGNYDQALSLFRDAVEIRRKTLGQKHPLYAKSLTNLALAYQALGQEKLAVKHFRESMAIKHEFLDTTFSAQTHHDRLQLIDSKRSDLDSYLSIARAAELTPSEIYQHVLHWKGLATARHGEEMAALDQPNLRSLVKKVRVLRASLARQLQLNPPTAKEQKAWRKRLKDTQSDLEQAEVELAQKSQVYRHFLESRKIDAKKILEILPGNTAFIDFVFYEHFVPDPKNKGIWQLQERLLAFVLTPRHGLGLVDLKEAVPIKKSILQWRVALETNTNEPAAGQELRERIWEPLQPYLHEAKTVLIAPDGVLCQLPFAALPGRKKGSYLLEEQAIGYVVSARQLLDLDIDENQPKSKGFLAVGGLNYGTKSEAENLVFGPAKHNWRELPGTLQEVKQVEQLFGKHFWNEPLLVLQGDKSKAAEFFKQIDHQNKQKWRYIHLATHGWFKPPAVHHRLPMLINNRKDMAVNQPPLMRCGLVFAGANTNPDQGFLYGYEIEKLDLRGTDLVVLSACNTALGKTTSGEGAQGLQMAFHLAGTRSQIASLWSVHDGATAVLMQEFYKNLWEKKLPKLEALRQAQLSILRNPERVHKYTKKLYQELVKRGVPEALLAERGIAKKAVQLPTTHSPVRWWGAFVLSGDME